MGKKPAQQGERACSYKHQRFLGVGRGPRGAAEGRVPMNSISSRWSLARRCRECGVRFRWGVSSLPGAPEAQGCDCTHNTDAHPMPSRGLGDLHVGGGRDPSNTQSGHSIQERIPEGPQDFPKATREGGAKFGLRREGVSGGREPRAK